MKELSELRPFRCRLSFEEIEKRKRTSFVCVLAYLTVLFLFSFHLFLSFYETLLKGGAG